MNRNADGITEILEAVGRGEASVANDVFPVVYDELRRLASAQLRQERANHTLNTTVLVHEAYLRLIGAEGLKWADRRYFFAAAGIAIRRILVEHARKRRHCIRLLTTARLIDDSRNDLIDFDWEDLDRALETLTHEDAQLGEVVHLRFFAGMNREQTAAALSVSESTVKRNWAYARARLVQLMNDA